MKKQILILIFIIVIFNLTMISADDSLSNWVFKKGDVVDLKVPCFNNNTYCGISSTCYATIFYPNGSIMVNNETMTNSGTFHNYTLNSSYIIGTYEMSVVCEEGGSFGCATFNFNITSTGTGNDLVTFIVILTIAAFLLIISFIFKNYIFSFISGLTFLVDGVYTMINGFGILPDIYVKIISIILIGLGAIITLISTFNFLGETSGETEAYEE